jgi:outer membrane lipoprotein-sorting protein
MINYDHDIEQLFENIPLDDTPSPAHRDQLEHRLLAAYAQRRFSDQKKHIWRTIMKSKLTKLAAAAVIFIAAGILTLTLTHTQPAWAIEQTIKAMESIDSVFISGRIVWNKGKTDLIKIWARPNKLRSMSGDYKSEIGDNEVIIANEKENATYKYIAADNTINIHDGITSMIGPVFNSGEALRMIKDTVDDWQESYGTENGKNCIFIKIKQKPESLSHCKSMLLTFDLETHLPIKVQGWEKSDFSGEPILNFDEFIYNPELPEGIFNFVIPEGAKVVDERTTTGAGQK